MKLLTGIMVILLTIFGIVVSNLDDEGKSAEDELNMVRRKYAERFGNGPLPELVHDELLTSIARTFSPECEKWTHGPNYRFTMTSGDPLASRLLATDVSVAILSAGYEQLPISDEEKNQYAVVNDAMDEISQKYSIVGMELLNPAQTNIGCANTRCTGKVTDEFKVVFNTTKETYTYASVCLFGPKNQWAPGELKKYRKMAFETVKDVQNLKMAVDSNRRFVQWFNGAMLKE